MSVLNTCLDDGMCVDGVPADVVADVKAQVAVEVDLGFKGYHAVRERHQQLKKPVSAKQSREMAAEKARAIRKQERLRRERRMNRATAHSNDMQGTRGWRGRQRDEL